MNKQEMIYLLEKLQDCRDNIYILGNPKSAVDTLELLIKMINNKLVK